MNELKARGVEDIAVVEGMKGFPEAIEAVFPLTAVQTCIVLLTRNSVDFVSWKIGSPSLTNCAKSGGRPLRPSSRDRPHGRGVTSDRRPATDPQAPEKAPSRLRP
jgi:putative transposase